MSLLFTQDKPSPHLEETPAEYAARLADRFAIEVPVESRCELAQFFTPLIEAVTNASPIDGTRLKELKELFAGCTAGLVFVTAFLNRQGFLKCLEEVAWGTGVWVADTPDHTIHFNGEKFLGPNLRK